MFLDAEYPYTSGDINQVGVCKYNPSETAKIGVKVVYYDYLTYGDNAIIKKKLYDYGPLGARVNAANWRSYTGGLYLEPTCNGNNIDHSVLIVGYSTDASGQDYWICKNSWWVF